MLKPIKSNNSPGHSHNGHSSVVGLSFDSCPGIISKEDNKMKHKIKKQFVLCFLEKSDVVVDAVNKPHGIDVDTVEDMTLEVFGTFNSRFEALQELQSHEASDVEFTILEKLQVVKEDK